MHRQLTTATDRPTLPGSERSFGITVGFVLCVIAGLLFWRSRPVRAEITATAGLLLLLLGAFRPSLLARPRVWWWRAARVVGDFNARVLLTVVFALVFVPLGLFWRLTGRDPLGRRPANAGWTPYPARYRDRRHYLRMY
jgi:hypothetical protein